MNILDPANARLYACQTAPAQTAHLTPVIGDEDSELILGVDLRAGNAGEGEGAAGLLESVQGTDGGEVETVRATWPTPTATYR